MKGNSSISYRPDIDGLRAMAIIPVVVFHAFPNILTGGFSGVDVFFVISGFLITSIIMNGVNNSSFSILSFYIKRINRIFPALSIVLISCLIFGFFALYPDEFMQLGKHTASGAGFVANIVFALESGYFDTDSNKKILLHLWSLGVEEQFYLLWPLFIFFFKKNRGVFFLIFTSLSFLASIYYVRIDPTIAFYSPITRLWELSIGASIPLLKIEITKNNSLRKHLDAISALGFILLVYSFIFLSKSHFPGYKAIIPVTGAILIILAGKEAFINRVILSNKAFVFVGAISYPLYLWHWPVFTFTRIINSGSVSNVAMLSLVILSIILSILTYRFLEIPIRLFKNKSLSALVFFIVMLFIGLAGAVIYASNGSISSAESKRVQFINSQFTGSTWPYLTNETCLDRYPYENSSSFRWWFCVENKPAKPDIILIGTSYANHHFPGFIESKELGNKTILSIGTCDPAIVDNRKFTGNHPCSENKPEKQNIFIKNIISSEKSIKYAIIDGLDPDPTSAYEIKLSDYIGFLIKENITPIVFVPHVEPKFDTKGCISRPMTSSIKNCNVPRPNRDKFKQMMKRIEKNYSTVKTFDQNNAYCSDNECNFILNDIPMFRDTGHYSHYGSVTVTKKFIEWAKTNEPEIIN